MSDLTDFDRLPVVLALRLGLIDEATARSAAEASEADARWLVAQGLLRDDQLAALEQLSASLLPPVENGPVATPLASPGQRTSTDLYATDAPGFGAEARLDSLLDDRTLNPGSGSSALLGTSIGSPSSVAPSFEIPDVSAASDGAPNPAADDPTEPDPDGTVLPGQSSGTATEPEPVGEGDSFITTAPTPEVVAALGGTMAPARSRFRVLKFHAKGGLGVVYVANDEELQRPVALKEIQHRGAFDPDSRQRFVLEAEITGGLEHPGIVPVYGLGRYPDGRPYYAMRLIEGDSLKQAVERFHSADQDRRDPGDRELELRKLLRRFLDVCNAMAYAHSRGVLHRDLKPANIMLGPYGETLVVDWGLAKLMGPDAVPEGRLLRPSSTAGRVGLLPPQVVGTPQYMSPEQAGGEVNALGPASDVYSLGATLYSILTGRTPVKME
jgi:hypothetical protein